MRSSRSMPLMFTMRFRFISTAIMVLALSSTFLRSAEPAVEAAGQTLDQAANDPTAALTAYQIQDLYVVSYHHLNDEDGNSIQLRIAKPWSIAGVNNIARATLPIVTDSPSGANGLGDLTLFDLVVMNQSWGRWGFGPVALLPTASNDRVGAAKWALGPAAGFTMSYPGLLLGVFNQNLFSYAGDDQRRDVEVSILQPIVNYSLPERWSVGLSEMNVTYDWESSRWANLPLGGKVSKLVKVSGIPTQFSGSYEYNLADDQVAPKWTMNLTVKVLIP